MHNNKSWYEHHYALTKQTETRGRQNMKQSQWWTTKGHCNKLEQEKSTQNHGHAQ